MDIHEPKIQLLQKSKEINTCKISRDALDMQKSTANHPKLYCRLNISINWYNLPNILISLKFEIKKEYVWRSYTLILQDVYWLIINQPRKNSIILIISCIGFSHTGNGGDPPWRLDSRINVHIVGTGRSHLSGGPQGYTLCQLHILLSIFSIISRYFNNNIDDNFGCSSNARCSCKDFKNSSPCVALHYVERAVIKGNSISNMDLLHV